MNKSIHKTKPDDSTVDDILEDGGYTSKCQLCGNQFIIRGISTYRIFCTKKCFLENALQKGLNIEE